MSTRRAVSTWNGTLKEGKGVMTFGSFSGPYTFASRFEEGAGTNPEELAGAAHSGCFSMFLAALITEDGRTPTSVRTTAAVHLGQNDGPMITKIELSCEAVVPGLAPKRFAELAQKAKEKCPISRLFAGTEITLKAELRG